MSNIRELTEEYKRFLKFIREHRQEILEKILEDCVDVNDMVEPDYHGYPTIEEEIEHFRYDPWWEIKAKEGE